jgi:hypothetical protein
MNARYLRNYNNNNNQRSELDVSGKIVERVVNCEFQIGKNFSVRGERTSADPGGKLSSCRTKMSLPCTAYSIRPVKKSDNMQI